MTRCPEHGGLCVGDSCCCADRHVVDAGDMSKPEPPPKPGTGRPIWELVIDDMKARDDFGRAKYGTPLRAGDGRKHLVDAYQEALDLAVYIRQEMEERDQRIAALEEQLKEWRIAAELVIDMFGPSFRPADPDNLLAIARAARDRHLVTKAERNALRLNAPDTD